MELETVHFSYGEHMPPSNQRKQGFKSTLWHRIICWGKQSLNPFYKSLKKYILRMQVL